MVAMTALAALIALMVVVAAIVAFLKRETWTLPAYRQARDRTGQWSVTPWSPPAAASGAETDQPQEETEPPVESSETTP